MTTIFLSSLVFEYGKIDKIKTLSICMKLFCYYSNTNDALDFEISQIIVYRL